jgi:hypothetical protein
MIANFCKSEPNFAAFMVMLHGKPLLTDPVSIGILSAVLYCQMRDSQDEADNLKKGISNADQ